MSPGFWAMWGQMEEEEEEEAPSPSSPLSLQQYITTHVALLQAHWQA